jgi:hypothetical protein
MDCLIENNFDPGCGHYFLEELLVQTKAKVVTIFKKIKRS